MNDNKVMREKISALADGELSEFETRRILSEIKHNPAYREFWRNIHLVRDLFDESEDILYERDISTNLRSRLRDDISIETNENGRAAIEEKKLFDGIACKLRCRSHLLLFFVRGGHLCGHSVSKN